MYICSRFSEFYKLIFTLNLIAVGYSPDDSSSTRRDFSILRLSAELPFGIKAAVKSCSDKCKSERKPFELALSFGFSEIIGRLSIGFGATSYKLAALSQKLYIGGWEPRYVCLIIQRGQPLTSFPSKERLLAPGPDMGDKYACAVEWDRVLRFTILINRVSVLPLLALWSRCDP